MNHEQKRLHAGRKAQSVPTPLAAFVGSILSQNEVRVGEREDGSREIDSVLGQVRPVLLCVPFEPHPVLIQVYIHGTTKTMPFEENRGRRFSILRYGKRTADGRRDSLQAFRPAATVTAPQNISPADSKAFPRPPAPDPRPLRATLKSDSGLALHLANPNSFLRGHEALHVRWYWTSGALCGARGNPYGTEIDGRLRVRTRNTRSIASAFDRITRESQSNRQRRCCGERTISRRCGSIHWRPETHGDKTRAPAAATKKQLSAIGNRLFRLPS